MLTSNVITFTGDKRFSCLHEDRSDNWTLQIKYTQMKDAGEYQCQVNTEPKISLPVNLVVAGRRKFFFIKLCYAVGNNVQTTTPLTL